MSIELKKILDVGNRVSGESGIVFCAIIRNKVIVVIRPQVRGFHLLSCRVIYGFWSNIRNLMTLPQSGQTNGVLLETATVLLCTGRKATL